MAKTDETVAGQLIAPPEAALSMTPDRAVRVEDDADWTDIQQLQQRYGAIEFPGANIVPKLWLIGVPFIIAGLRFQQAMSTPERGERDYVTVAAFVQDENILQGQIDRGRVLKTAGRDAEPYTNVADLPVKPRERILFNDGSTGVRRQLVELLERLGLVRVGDRLTDEDNPRRKFDQAWTQWENPFVAADQVPCGWTSADGTLVPEYPSFPDGRPFIVSAPRGLTGSVYPSDFAPSGWATTYYVR